MPILTMSLSSFFSCSSVASQYIIFIGEKSKMIRIATETIIADMVNHRNILALSTRKSPYQPFVNKTVCSISNFVNSDTAITIDSCSSPIPATCNIININFIKEATHRFSRDFHTPIIARLILL